jgi:hypothetical protein
MTDLAGRSFDGDCLLSWSGGPLSHHPLAQVTVANMDAPAITVAVGSEAPLSVSPANGSLAPSGDPGSFFN